MEGSARSMEIEVASGVRVESPIDLNAAGTEAIDSKATAWEGRTLSVVVDEGVYADPLTSYEQRGARVSEESIGGRHARLVTFTLDDGAQFAAAHFPADNGSEALTIAVTGRGEHGGETPLRVLRSVKFT